MQIPGDTPTPAQMVPTPAGTQRVAAPVPVRLSEQVAGALSRMQGLIQASEVRLSDAYAAHWLATREAGRIPEFQQATAPMLWGLYGMETLAGLLRIALTGGATTEVMGGIVDMINLINASFQQADQAWAAFLQRPEARELTSIDRLMQTLQPLGRTFTQMQQPAQLVLRGVNWRPWMPAQVVPLRHAFVEPTTVQPTPGWLQQPMVRPQWETD